MNLKWIYRDNLAANCFFRSSLQPPDLKIMLQITNRCNLHCKHCFLSATDVGDDLPYSTFSSFVTKFADSNVKKVTLTGGEPLLHSHILDMVADLDAISVQTCICTNASLVTENLLIQLEPFNVHFNVSLDGISPHSHGSFRELASSTAFDQILENIRLIGQHGMLNGILATPNRLSAPDEYVEICDFAIEANAKYFLLNPLSPFGRGRYAENLTPSPDEMRAIKSLLDEYLLRRGGNPLFQIVYIRFPNDSNKEFSPCTAGLIPYVFTSGDIAICPYMVFAAENSDNDYNPSDFIIGNVLDKGTIAEKVRAYQKTHCFCYPGRQENQGCAAMKIARNLPLDSKDSL